jgi:hypothetical protein
VLYAIGRDANFWGRGTDPVHILLSRTDLMTSRPQSFVKLSAAVTGFSPVILHGTGMTQAYLKKVETIVPSRLLDRLFDTFENASENSTLLAAAAGARSARAPSNSARTDLTVILDDPDLGPVARAIAVLWYCGSWTELPDAWRARNGAAPGDVTGVVSAAAYQAGLQWTVVGAHPAGARQQGFGAWSTEPADLVS